MEINQAKVEYDTLSSKYKFNNISFKQIDIHADIDELINNINHITRDNKNERRLKKLKKNFSLIKLSPVKYDTLINNFSQHICIRLKR